MPTAAQESFAKRCGTTIGYLRKAISTKARLGWDLCVALERESFGRLTCEQLRPDVDWAYLRGKKRVGKRREPSSQAS